MSRITVLTSLLAAFVVLTATIGPVRASVITTGDVDPGGAGTQGDSWPVGSNRLSG